MYSSKESGPAGLGSSHTQTFSGLIEKKGTLAGACVSIGSVLCGQILARSGFDWIFIDMEHSPMSAEKVTALTQAIVAASAGQCVPVIRTPSHGVEWIKWALDCGAPGIIIPMVNNAIEAESIIQRALYPPRGQRSFGPFLAPFADTDSSSDVAKYLSQKTVTLAIILMIESVEGVKNAEEILSVKGVTGCFIGSFDLRSSLGLPGGDGEEPEFIEALEKVLAIGRRLSLHIGTVASSEAAAKRKTEMGFSFLLTGTDSAFLVSGATHASQQATNGVKSARTQKL